MLIGAIAALAHGVTLPLMIVIFGNLLKIFTDRIREFCALDYTSLAIQACPGGYQLSPANFLSSFA